MRLLRLAAIGAFFAGIAVLVVGLACSGGDDKVETPTAVPTDTATATPTDTPTQTPTPTPTPTPFDGKLARMKIPSLKVDYPIEELGIKMPQNELDTPKDATGKIGWYYIYKKPGWGENALFSAHVNYNGKDGPFAKLSKAVEGDEVIVTMEGGPEYRYKVISKVRYDIYNIKMGEIIDPPTRPKGKEWVTLITCSCEPGRIVNINAQGYGDCLDRDVVVAERVS